MQKSYPTAKTSSGFSLRLPVCGVVAAAMLLHGVLATPARAGGGKGDPSIAAKELERRLKLKDEAQLLITEGDALAAKKDQCGAAEKYREAAQLLLPGAPATLSLRTEAVRKFAVSGVVCARELAETGDYEKANARLDQILAADMAPKDKPALTLQRHLKDPDRFNPAMTPAHGAEVKKVANLLMMGDHFAELGEFDLAKKSYDQVLAIDPTNSAARRGQERAEREITAYHKTARDAGRSQMLNEVDRQWEPGVPSLSGIRPGSGAGESGVVPTGSTAVASKLRTLIIPRLSFSDAAMPEVVAYLVRKSIEVDTSAPDERSRGVNIIWMREDTVPRPVTMDLKNVSLGEALRSICESSGTRYHTDGSVVKISTRGGGLETRQFKVPPGFLSTAATAVADTAATTDPFGTAGGDTGKPKLSRLDAKTFLERLGVPFPEGSRAGYNASNNLLSVTNTPENLDVISQFVEGLDAAGQKQVLVQVTMLKCSQTDYQELGLDLIVGQFKAGGGVFGSGGTAGNSELGGTANSPGNFGATAFQPIQVPFGVTQGIVTGGLRSSYELTRTQTIDDLINLSNNSLVNLAHNRSPFNFALAGTFTNPQFQSLFRGLEQKKGIDLAVATKTIVKSGQRASAFSGRKFSYPTEFEPPQIPQTVRAPQSLTIDPVTGQLGVVTGSIGTPPVTPATPTGFQEKDIGSSIEVEATVTEDNYTVELTLALLFSEFDGFINYGTPITSDGVVLTDNRIIQPVFTKAAANALVRVSDGQTVAIGGLTEGKVTTVQDRVPFLSSIPLIGRLFKSNLQSTTRTVLMYFVTVSIVDPAGDKLHGSKEVTTGTPDSGGPADSILLPAAR